MQADDKRPDQRQARADVPQPPEKSEFESVRTRLAEIAEAVEDENLALDEALDLYEEAVSLGLQASDLLEIDIPLEDETVADGGGIPSETGEES